MCSVFVFRIEIDNEDMTQIWIDRFKSQGWQSYPQVIGQSYPPYKINAIRFEWKQDKQPGRFDLPQELLPVINFDQRIDEINSAAEFHFR